MLRLMEVASQSETFVKLYLEKSKSKNVNRHELFDCPAAGDTLEVFSLDRPPLLAVIPRPSGSRRCYTAPKWVAPTIQRPGRARDHATAFSPHHPSLSRAMAATWTTCQKCVRLLFSKSGAV